MDLDTTSSTSAVHLIGVSVPRSGHNLVVRLLKALVPGDLFYCERYLAEGCCQALPCVRRATRQITFQKSHDLEHDLPRNVADACYLVQHRPPVPAVLSARELYADEYGEMVAGDRDEYEVWLGRWAEYLTTFHERWIADPPRNGVVVDYDDLVNRPVEALRRIVDAAGIDVSDVDLATAVERTVPHGGLFGERPFVPRSIEKSRYFDRELLAVFETIVVDALPEYASSRAFEPVECRETLIWHVYSARRARRAGDAETARQLLDEAIGRWPENGLLLYEQSWLLLKQERYAEAQRLLERAAVLCPAHPRILDLLVTAALAAGDAPAALVPMRRLADEVEPTLANRVRLAKVLAHNSDRPGAAAIIDEVTHAAPKDAQVWRDVSEVRLVRGEFSAARIALETALGLAPLQPDLCFRHGEVLLTLGKARRAVDALRQSLALDPRRPAAWKLLVEALSAADDRAGIVQASHEARAALPYDAALHNTMAEARRWALTAPIRDGTPGERRSSSKFGMAGRVRGVVGRLPGARLLQRVGRAGRRLSRARVGPVSQDAIQVTQLRAALGVAEQRLDETEQRLYRDLDEAWSQATRLEFERQRLDQALAEAHAERAAAWKQAHLLADALEAQAREAERAGAQAERLAAALAEREDELQELRLRAWRLEEALRAAGAMEERQAGLANLMRRS